MAKLQPVRGTRDITGEEARRQRYVVDVFRRVAEAYGFDEIATPIFEFTEVFKRTLGETSDVVAKEMYTFTDRSGDEITLRPEYTAGIARAWMTQGLAQQGVAKLYGWGPMFRHERPQKGRYRQFSQINVEVIGAPEPAADIELIAMARQVLDDLGIADQTVLHLNTLGDPESRAAYRQALVTYLNGHRDRLSKDSQARLARNPMRILDSKDEGDRVIVAEAPKMANYLNPASREFFDTVRRGLDALGIPYREDHALVRGLDYYTHTAFEFITETLGAQGTVLGGGRYDGLMEQLGGPATPGVGWAGGIERIAMMLSALPESVRGATMVPLGAPAQEKALVLARDLRAKGLRIDTDYRGSLKKRMARANRRNARYAIIIGEEELAAGTATVRDLDSGGQTAVAFDALASHIGPQI